MLNYLKNLINKIFKKKKKSYRLYFLSDRKKLLSLFKHCYQNGNISLKSYKKLIKPYLLHRDNRNLHCGIEKFYKEINGQYHRLVWIKTFYIDQYMQYEDFEESIRMKEVMKRYCKYLHYKNKISKTRYEYCMKILDIKYNVTC